MRCIENNAVTSRFKFYRGVYLGDLKVRLDVGGGCFVFFVEGGCITDEVPKMYETDDVSFERRLFISGMRLSMLVSTG